METESDWIKTNVEPEEVVPHNKQGRKPASVDKEKRQQDSEEWDACKAETEKGGRGTHPTETNPEVATEEVPGISSRTPFGPTVLPCSRKNVAWPGQPEERLSWIIGIDLSGGKKEPDEWTEKK
ncbi:hypothetical protein NDU88_009262 [Pleurodeles waltl]|uniref:Uncharacterized protein n=1 Tax=Pleurodeles waltl TaxID=8319 RepID=A0AAV7QSH3_PLEWA|nr:hypothetical protein NDU88_009262 [Pleurodeles waltl]